MDTCDRNGMCRVHGDTRPAILTVVDYYWPGFKAGGPVQSIKNLVDHLGLEFAFDIVTSDRDLGDGHPYPGIEPNRWLSYGNARVLYLPRIRRTIVGWWLLMRASTHQVWYFNSLFSRNTIKVLLLRRLGVLRRTPMLVAPRGELQPGAMALKPRRKKLFLRFARVVHLFSGVSFQASTAQESRELKETLEANGWVVQPEISAAPNLSRVIRIEVGVDLPQRHEGSTRPLLQPSGKKAGHASMIFLSRLSRKKNLAGALRVLGRLRGEVSLDIYGPIEDPRYWAECLKLMDTLSSGIRATYRGVVTPAEVYRVFSSYHLFLFPTWGENFGHVIIEALQAGCPVLTTDRTPWTDLERYRAGWALPLEDEGAFVEKAQHVVDMDGASFEGMRCATRVFASSILGDAEAVEQNRSLFLRILRS